MPLILWFLKFQNDPREIFLVLLGKQHNVSVPVHSKTVLSNLKPKYKLTEINYQQIKLIE